MDQNTEHQQAYYQHLQQPQQYVSSIVPNLPVTTNVQSSLTSPQFWTGAAIGAAVALLLTNETVQKGVMKTATKVMAAASAGVEEIKEKFEDAKAEAVAESEGNAE